MRSPITSHILDTARGRPATGVRLHLAQQSADGTWQTLATGTTDKDGRVADLLPADSLSTGTYQLTFETAAYFERLNVPSFYPFIQVAFVVEEGQENEHYHVPLLLNPFGYSTYRGS